MPGHTNCLTPSELKLMLINAGFSNVDLSLNQPQPIKDIPKDLLDGFFKSFMPDIISVSAHALAKKI